MVTKIYFPRAVLPLSAVLACLFDMGISIIVLTILLMVFKIGFSFYLLLLPVFIFLLILFTAGLGLLLSSANLFYRDIKYVVEIILMFGIFFTPVFYSASSFGRWDVIMLFNPIGSLLEAIDQIVVFGKMPDPFWFGYAALTSLVMFYIGMVIFHKIEPLFAENI